MHSRKEILIKLKNVMKDHQAGTCSGCPITIYDENFGREYLAGTGCEEAAALLLKLLKPGTEYSFKGCYWLYNYVYEMKIDKRNNCKI